MNLWVSKSFDSSGARNANVDLLQPCGKLCLACMPSIFLMKEFFVTRNLLSLLTVFGLFCVSVGCGEPDPRKNPDFNEAAMSNPGAVQMAPMPNNANMPKK
jgi:hypothetical protein